MNRFIGFAIVSGQVEFVCATDNAAQTREMLDEFATNTAWVEYTYTVEAVDEKCHEEGRTPSFLKQEIERIDAEGGESTELRQEYFDLMGEEA